MINNSSLQKWDRLKQKQLDTLFVNTLIQGMNCSNFEAMAILNQVYDIYQPFFDNSATLKSGQVIFEVVSTENSPKIPLAQCKLVRATLTLDGGEEDLTVRKQKVLLAFADTAWKGSVTKLFSKAGS